ncbi:hypothetical protein ES703_87101 [subsurface metagenome]
MTNQEKWRWLDEIKRLEKSNKDGRSNYGSH